MYTYLTYTSKLYKTMKNSKNIEELIILFYLILCIVPYIILAVYLIFWLSPIKFFFFLLHFVTVVFVLTELIQFQVEPSYTTITISKVRKFKQMLNNQFMNLKIILVRDNFFIFMIMYVIRKNFNFLLFIPFQNYR